MTAVRRTRKLAGWTLAFLVLSVGAVPTTSGAATVSADRSCYIPGQPVTLTGSGYTPNGEVHASFDVRHANGGRVPSTLAFDLDGSGSFALELTTPNLDLLQSPADVTLSVRDQAQPEAPPTTTAWTISVFNVTVLPWEIGKGNPRKRAIYLATGFGAFDAKTLYAHYIFRGRLRKTAAIGPLHGDCGDLGPRRARQFPFRPVRAGTYRIEVDATRRWPNQSPGFVFPRVKVSRANAIR